MEGQGGGGEAQGVADKAVGLAPGLKGLVLRPLS
jgi:hypothetical protein